MKFLQIVLFICTIFVFQSIAQNLRLDNNFRPCVTDGDTSVYVTKPLADGKIMVGGGFRLVNGAIKTALARLNSDGSLDNTFNPGGSGPDNSVFEIVPLSNGKFLIGGLFTTYNGIAQSGIVRINSDGSLDTTFNTGGAGAAGNVQTIALQPDGKILFSGSFTSYNGTARFGVVRLNADGSLDTSFTSPFTSNQFVEEVDVQANGKILIGGTFSLSIPAFNHFARLNSDGSLDTSFAAQGLPDDYAVYAVTQQPDGKILIGGDYHLGNTPVIFWARLNPDGTNDNSFHPPFILGSGVEYFAVEPDGKILAAGGFDIGSSRESLIRLNADGTIDDTFVLNSANNSAYHVSLQTDGKILLGGFFTAFSGQTHLQTVRLNTNGTLDASFNPSISTFGSAYAVAQQTDGKILAGGNFNFASGVSRANISRFNADGSLDVSFNPGTGTSPDPIPGSNIINDIAVQPDGKIIIGGVFGGYNGTTRRGIARLNPGGSLDTSFNPTYFDNLSETVYIYDVFIEPDGKILVGGIFQTASEYQFLVRLNPNGSLDSSFTGSPNSTVRTIVRQPDGKLIIGGSFLNYSGQSRNRIARINSDGLLDTSFNPGSGFNSTVLDLALQNDGKILAVGQFTTFNETNANRIVRLNSNGSIDISFNPSSGADNTVYSVAVEPDGKLDIGGTFFAFNGFISNRLARLNSDGTVDHSFISGFDNNPMFNVRRVLLQSDGNLLVGGTFKTYNGITRNSLLRLTAANQSAQFDFDGDGKADVSVFRPSTGFWYINGSQSGFTGVQFGDANDKLVPADYDGDGKTDVAVFRPSNGTWYLNRSTAGYTGIQFGASTDVPLPADFDGDGRAELVVWRPSTGIWYVYNLVSNSYTGFQFGASTDRPVTGDFDGDGKADYAVFRPSTGIWYIQGSTAGFYGMQFGESTDKLVPADYDGDGKTDIAVFRPSTGTWYLNRSTAGFTSVQFGAASDLPTAADYDGDGKADIAVFRPSTGIWYIQNSNSGLTSTQFGASTDKPVENAYVP